MLDSADIVGLTADIVAAHVNNNNVAVGDVGTLIAAVHGALSKLGMPVEAPEAKLEPAVSIRASVKADAMTCLDCGKKFKMLKRHLATDHAITPNEYRAKWGLPQDYPMVASNYAQERKELALKIGLGRKAGTKAAKGRAKKA